VIAHPDDEALFFSPLLLAAKTAIETSVSILCLSNGNAQGLGVVRSKELYASAALYGIARDRVSIIDHAQLQDGMDQHWPPTLVADIVARHVQELNDLVTDTTSTRTTAAAKAMVDVLVTFDARGVSGHVNHIATCNGVKLSLASLASSSSSFSRLRCFHLTTTNAMRRFAGPFDLLLSLWFSRNVEVAVNANLWAVYHALFTHESQNVWYRKIFVFISRYSYINTFEENTY